jgi:molecular chaperone GrpE
MSEKTDNSIEIEIKDQEDLQEQDTQSAKVDEGIDDGSEEKQESEETLDYYDQLLRVQAELQNYKRRSEQRMQEWRMYAAKDIISQLLPVIDDFDILFQHHPDGSEKIRVDGVKMIYNKMMAALRSLGLDPIDAEKQEFDPHLHEAMMAEETDQVEEGHVLKVWQRGFMFKDQLLRPAKVITAKAKSDGENHGE